MTHGDKKVMGRFSIWNVPKLAWSQAHKLIVDSLDILQSPSNQKWWHNIFWSISWEASLHWEKWPSITDWHLHAQVFKSQSPSRCHGSQEEQEEGSLIILYWSNQTNDKIIKSTFLKGSGSLIVAQSSQFRDNAKDDMS